MKKKAKTTKKKTAKKRVSKKTSRKTTTKKRTYKKKSSPKIAQTKSKLPKRISTTIPNFDVLIEGGFDKNSTNLIVGGAGSGKTIFATQFLFGGMEKGEKCLYVTFEEKKQQFYENMLRFGWDLKTYEKKGLFTFLEYTPAKVKTMLEEGGGAIETIILKKKISRIVIDSITSFALLFDKELERREAALSLFNMISKWNCTSLLTFEGSPIKDGKMTSRALEFESDAIIVLYYIRNRGQRERYLEILKMRGTKHSKKVYGFNIESSGIVVESKPTKNIKI